MGFTQTINYDDADDFTFNSTLIDLSTGAAKLKLIPNPGQVFSQDFASSSGFTFDAALAEFTGGTVRQKDQRPSGALYYNNFDVGANATWASGAGTGTLFNSATVSGGKLNLPAGAAANNYLSILATGVVPTGQKGCIRFTFTPNYSGSANKDIFAMSAAQDVIGNLIRIVQTGTTLRLDIYNAAGTSIITSQTGNTFSPVAATPYEFELNWDVTTGTGYGARLFINGVLLNGTKAGTGVRDGTIALLRVGRNYLGSASDGLDGTIENLIIFDDTQHTTNYTPGASIPQTIYYGSTVVLPAFSYTGVGTIIAVDSSTITETGAPRYTVAGLYWNGSMWAASDGTYTQANPASVIIANLTSLNVSGATTVTVRIIFTATNTQAIVDLISVTVTGQIYPTSNPTIVNNSGISVGSLTDFLVEETISGDDLVKYTIVVGGIDKWWNGTAWATSNGTYAQSNTPADILTNIEALNLSTGFSVKFKAFLHSDTGQTFPTLTSLTVDYSFMSPPVAEPSRCALFLFLNDVIGMIGSQFEAELVVTNNIAFKYGDRMVAPFSRTFSFDADGYVETDASYLKTADATAQEGIVETESLAISPYTLTINYKLEDGTEQSITTEDIQVPNQVSKNIVELWNFEAA